MLCVFQLLHYFLGFVLFNFYNVRILLYATFHALPFKSKPAEKCVVQQETCEVEFF